MEHHVRSAAGETGMANTRQSFAKKFIWVRKASVKKTLSFLQIELQVAYRGWTNQSKAVTTQLFTTDNFPGSRKDNKVWFVGKK